MRKPKISERSCTMGFTLRCAFKGCSCFDKIRYMTSRRVHESLQEESFPSPFDVDGKFLIHQTLTISLLCHQKRRICFLIEFPIPYLAPREMVGLSRMKSRQRSLKSKLTFLQFKAFSFSNQVGIDFSLKWETAKR